MYILKPGTTTEVSTETLTTPEALEKAETTTSVDSLESRGDHGLGSLTTSSPGKFLAFFILKLYSEAQRAGIYI